MQSCFIQSLIIIIYSCCKGTNFSYGELIVLHGVVSKNQLMHTYLHTRCLSETENKCLYTLYSLGHENPIPFNLSNLCVSNTNKEVAVCLCIQIYTAPPERQLKSKHCKGVLSTNHELRAGK